MKTLTSVSDVTSLSIDEHRTLGDQIAYAYGSVTLLLMPAYFADFGPGLGTFQFYPESGRCGRCDSRYCVKRCMAGAPGYVFVKGQGWGEWVKIARRVAEIAEMADSRLEIEIYPRSFDPVDIAGWDEIPNGN